MASSYPLISLKDAEVALIDCVHKTPAAASKGYPYVAIPQMSGGRLDLKDVRLISEEDLLLWNRKCDPKPGDVILSRRCNPGVTAVVPPNFKGTLGQNLVLLRSSGKQIDRHFLRWVVREEHWWNEISRYLNVGAVFDSLKCADIPNITVPLPPLPEQKAIAHILGTLDDKIELNRRTNETLEAIAKAIFKSWFVDFDHVRAKAEGRPTGLSKEISDLFPDSFEDSELGEVPKEWRVSALSEIATCIKDSVKPEFITENSCYIGLEHMPRGSVCLSEWGHATDLASNKYKFRQGDLLFGKLRPYFRKVGIALADGICSTDVLVIRQLVTGYLGFILGCISSDSFIDYTSASSTGTRMPRTSWDQMCSYKFAIPTDAIAIAYNSIVDSVFERFAVATNQNRTMAEIRDALLPQLISGELRIPDAEALVAEAGL